MTKDESYRWIIEEWEQWKSDPNRATYDEMRDFFNWVEDNRPELLQWKTREGVDRWQDVQGWLKVRTNYGRS
jgi:hypothetical protein